LLERHALFGESALQGPRAGTQLLGDVLEPRPSPGQERSQDALDPFADGFRSERLRQLGLELRSDRREEIRVVRDERAVDVRLVEHDDVLTSVEGHTATEVRFVHLPAPGRPAQLHSPGLHEHAGPAARDAQQVGVTQVHQDGRLRLLRQQPAEQHPTLVSPLNDAQLFRAHELLVARQALQRVPKGPGRDGGDADGVVTLDAAYALAW
jgi:hypothetical protein